MKIKDLNIPSMINRQLVTSGLKGTNAYDHHSRVEFVLRKFRNRKIDRVKLNELFNYIDSAFSSPEERGMHKYSITLFDDYRRKLKSKPCQGITVSCPNCKGKGHLRPRVLVDKKSTNGELIYLCDNHTNGCVSYVGVHRGDNMPLGQMAGREVRNMRVQAHKLIDKFCTGPSDTRKNLYRLLGEKLGINNFHIARLNEKGCHDLFRLLDSGWY